MSVFKWRCRNNFFSNFQRAINQPHEIGARHLVGDGFFLKIDDGLGGDGFVLAFTVADQLGDAVPRCGEEIAILLKLRFVHQRSVTGHDLGRVVGHF